MAAETVTPANVLASASAVIKYGTANATITAGQVVAIVSGLVVLCDASETTAQNIPVGIAITGAFANQRVYYVSSDPSFKIGFVGAIGDTLWTSTTAGGITKTAADNVTGIYVASLGVIYSTDSYAKINITYAGFAKA